MDSSIMISGHEDINRLLLLRLQYQDIKSFHSVNKYYSSLLKDPIFWCDKMRYDYKNFVAPNKIKNNCDKCIELYEQLLENNDIKLLELAEKHEYFEVVGWMAKTKKSIFTSGTNLLAKYGQLDILQNHLRFTSPDSRGVTDAALNRYYDSVDFIYQKWKLFPTISTIIQADKLNVLQVLWEKYSYLFSQKDASDAAREGKLDIVKWFSTVGLLPDLNGLNGAARCGKLDILQWAHDEYGLLPNVTGIDNALINNYYDVVVWLKQFDIIPSHNSIFSLIKRGDIELLEEFLTIKIYPSDKDFKYAVERKNVDIVKLFLQYEIKPDGYTIDMAIMNHDWPILRLFEQHAILPDRKGANKAAEYGYIDILDWLLVYNILPNVIGANKAAGANKFDSLLWLKKYGILPTTRGANLAACNGHYEMLLSLARQNVLPDGDVYRNDIIGLAAGVKDESLLQNYLKILEFLIIYDIVPHQNQIYNTLYFDSRILELFLRHNLAPKKYHIDLSRDRIQDEKVVALLKSYHLW